MVIFLEINTQYSTYNMQEAYKETSKYNIFLLHDPVLCDNSPPFIVQKLQLLTTELSLVTIASNSPLMIGQQTCETLLSSKWSGSVFAVSGNSCACQEWEVNY